MKALVVRAFAGKAIFFILGLSIFFIDTAEAQQSCGTQRECACAGTGKWRECNHSIWLAQQPKAPKTRSQSGYQNQIDRNAARNSVTTRGGGIVGQNGMGLVGNDGSSLRR